MIRSIYNFKLFLFLKVFLIYFILCINPYADDSVKSNSFPAIGSNDALVKIKIFSSLTCPHCANFHIKIVPKIIEEYVETGKVQLLFIDFPLDQAAFNASKLLHCVDQNKQLKYLDTIYENQTEWTNGVNIDEINNNLKKIVENLGISPDKFSKCLINETISDKILNERINSNKKYSIESTPTIIINEKKLEGSASFKNIKKKIEKII